MQAFSPKIYEPFKAKWKVCWRSSFIVYAFIATWMWSFSQIKGLHMNSLKMPNFSASRGIRVRCRLNRGKSKIQAVFFSSAAQIAQVAWPISIALVRQLAIWAVVKKYSLSFCNFQIHCPNHTPHHSYCNSDYWSFQNVFTLDFGHLTFKYRGKRRTNSCKLFVILKLKTYLTLVSGAMVHSVSHYWLIDI